MKMKNSLNGNHLMHFLNKTVLNHKLLFFLIAVIAFSCGKYPGYDKTKSGLYYKIYKTGKDTIKPKIGDLISMDVYFTAKVKGKDTLIFSNKREMQGKPVQTRLMPSDYPGDLNEGLKMLSVGDSAIFLFNADSLFLKTYRMPQRPKGVDSNSVVSFHVHLISLSTPYPGFNMTSSGLYYKITKVGTDTIRPKPGDWVALDVRIACKIDGKDTLLYDSKSHLQGYPEQLGVLKPEEVTGDFIDGIHFMSPGDSGIFITSPQSRYFKMLLAGQHFTQYEKLKDIFIYVHYLSNVKPDKMKESQSLMLNKYISDNKITAKPDASGRYIINTANGSGSKIDSGSMIKFHIKLSLANGKTIFSTYDQKEPAQMQYGSQVIHSKGLNDAIKTMKKGTKAKVIVPPSLGFGDQGDGSIIPPYATLIYEVEMVSVQSKAEYEKEMAAQKKKQEAEQAAEKKKTETQLEPVKKQESTLREKYLKDHNIKVQPTPSGLIYVERVKGTGVKASAGKKVKVHYTGTLLNGTKFDSSRDRKEPFEFVLGQGQVIQGWDEGIAMMRVGGKATLIIPSNIAYGGQQKGDVIPPYSTLVFDVELMEVK